MAGYQWAPTVQATRSNYERVHGGQPTWLIDDVLGAPEASIDVEHSEQGSQFLGKFNRNRTVVLDAPKPPSGWRWVESSTMRGWLASDFTLNTDARSVIVSGAWRLLLEPGRRPFEGGGLEPRLAGAFNESLAEVCEARLAAARGRLGRHPAIPPRRIPLGASQRFLRPDTAVRSDDGRVWAGFFEAHLPDRERPRWCQPLLLREEQGMHLLVYRVEEGRAFFRLTLSMERGFLHGAEWGPTFQAGRGMVVDQWIRTARQRLHLLRAVRQSDEGGRFFQQVSEYAVMEDRGELAFECLGGGIWVTLGELEQLSTQRGTLTNELRSLLSLVISHI